MNAKHPGTEPGSGRSAPQHPGGSTSVHVRRAVRTDVAAIIAIFAEDAVARRWHRALHAKGRSAPAWPAEYGGPGWSPTQREIFAMECARAGTPSLPSMGITLCGPGQCQRKFSRAVTAAL